MAASSESKKKRRRDLEEDWRTGVPKVFLLMRDRNCRFRSQKESGHRFGGVSLHKSMRQRPVGRHLV